MKTGQVRKIRRNWGSLKDHTRTAVHETYALMMRWVEADLDFVMNRLNGAVVRLDDWMRKREQSIHRSSVRKEKRHRRSEHHSGSGAKA